MYDNFLVKADPDPIVLEGLELVQFSLDTLFALTQLNAVISRHEELELIGEDCFDACLPQELEKAMKYHTEAAINEIENLEEVLQNLKAQVKSIE